MLSNFCFSFCIATSISIIMSYTLHIMGRQEIRLQPQRCSSITDRHLCPSYVILTVPQKLRCATACLCRIQGPVEADARPASTGPWPHMRELYWQVQRIIADAWSIKHRNTAYQ